MEHLKCMELGSYSKMRSLDTFVLFYSRLLRSSLAYFSLHRLSEHGNKFWLTFCRILQE